MRGTDEIKVMVPNQKNHLEFAKFRKPKSLNDLWVANAPDLTLVRDTNNDDLADEYRYLGSFLSHRMRSILSPIPDLLNDLVIIRIITFNEFTY